MSLTYCCHSALRRAVAIIAGKVWRRSKNRLPVAGACPICGLLPPGDWTVQYVLSIWFYDGDHRVYRFLGRHPNDCYSISEGVLRVHNGPATLSYSLVCVCTAEFHAELISSRPSVAPEVAEAERIIAGAPQNDAEGR